MAVWKSNYVRGDEINKRGVTCTNGCVLNGPPVFCVFFVINIYLGCVSRQNVFSLLLFITTSSTVVFIVVTATCVFPKLLHFWYNNVLLFLRYNRDVIQHCISIPMIFSLRSS